MAKTTAQILRDYRGPAIFSFGFRPFFLLSALLAVIAVPLWLISALGWAEWGAGTFTRDWHIHEMLFGYAGGVIVGYMTVAGPNWTGHYPVAGRPIAFFTLLWLAGRIAMLFDSGAGLISAIIDAAFLTLFALALWREQLAASNWRALPPCVVISTLAIANIGFHTGSAFPDIGQEISRASERLGIAAITFLIALMGGRLVLSFTRNWIAQQKILPEPVNYGRPDLISLVITGIALGIWVIFPLSRVGGVLLLIAGASLIVRLVRWRGWMARRDSMVLVLHFAYFWCATGLGLMGASALWADHVPQSAAIHMLGIGAIGVMTIAVMTRTSRSHTGRERRADTATAACYLLINVAVLTRVTASFLPDAYSTLLAVSALCWSAAFTLFIIAYGPMLIRPWHREKKKKS